MAVKRFGNKMYRGPMPFLSKRDANAKAAKFKKEGYLTKIIKSKDGVYELYMNLGTAKNKHWGRGQR
jgi:hypothetical protein